MSTAIWRSHNETVEVTRAISSKLWKDTKFRIKCKDGTTQLVERADILLNEEEALIEELASILKQYRQPPRSARYKEIMFRLLETGVPFNERLKSLMEKERLAVKDKMVDLIEYCGG